MTRRRNLEQHRHSLAEIRGIMNSMKTLAYMETRKLVHFLDAQHTVVQNIEDVAADFLSFHPETMPESLSEPQTEAKDTTLVYLLIGTERGFCGDFNHALLKFLESDSREHFPGSPKLIVVGRKLSTLVEGDTRVVARIDGASTAEEVTPVLSRMVHELSLLQKQYQALNVYGLYHDGEDNIVMQKLLPPFQHLLQRPSGFSYAPVLNLPPAEFLSELTDLYLFAVLHEKLYTSLMAENYKRVGHLEGAVKHMDDESEELARQCNVLRQEEIIEEIEVILLNAASLDDGWQKQK